MIELIDVNKYVKKRHIIKNYNYTFTKGNIYLIKGPSGIGKTTLLNIIGGIIPFDSGKISVNNIVLDKPFSKVNRELLRKEYGFIFQDFLLIDEYSAIENIKEVMDYTISEEDTKKYSLNIDIHQKVENLSGGEKQRLAIMRTLLKNPDILLCDEITANLDEENGQQIINIIDSYKSKDKIIIIASHDMRFKDIADYVIELKKD